MGTGETILVVGGVAVAVYLIARNTTTGAAAPPPASPAAPAAGGGGGFVNGVANGGAQVANVVGGTIGSYYLGPAGKLVGVQAATDTKYNILETANVAETGWADLKSGNVTGAGVTLAKGVANTAVQPLKTTYNIIKSLNPF